MPVEQKLPYRTPEVPASFGTFHWPTIVVGLIALLGANVIGTQFIASRFNYARALGTPLFQFGEYGFYAPWKWALWFLHYNKSNIPYVKNTVEIAIIMIVVLSAFSAAYVIVTNFRRSKKVMEGQEDIHGSARFATKEDLIQNGILKCEEGVYIGGFQDQQYVHYLKHNGPEHVIVAAPTRSGKGVGIVIPTLLGWDQSAIVYDLKGENWALTSGFRSKELKQTCLKFSPLEHETAHFNPLSVLRFGTTHEVGDARKLAEMLLDTGAQLNDDYFLKQAITLGAALILHLFYEARLLGYATPTPANLLDIATDADNGLKKVMEAVKIYKHRDPALFALNPESEIHKPFPGIRDHTLSTHPTIASTMSTMLLKGEKEFGSIIGSLTDPLQVYADPLVRDAVAYSDFNILDLVKKPISLYLVIPFPDQIRLKPLVRLFFSMAIYRLTEHMDFDKAKTVKNPYKLLFLIDEFPSLGKLEIFETAMAVMGGFGLRALLIIQDFEQLYKAYGQNETVVSNCHVKIVYAPNNQTTANKISEMTGKRTIRHASVSYSGSRTSSAQNQMSTSIQLVERELLTADEVTKLRKPTKVNPGEANEKIVGPGDMLIFIAGEYPIYGVQILFFLDDEFKRRAALPAPKADSTSLYTAPKERERPRSMVIDAATPTAPVEATAEQEGFNVIPQNLITKPLANKRRNAQPEATSQPEATDQPSPSDEAPTTTEESPESYPQELAEDEYAGL